MDLHHKARGKVTYRRPHNQPIEGQNMVRVFTIAPGELVLQMRTEKGFMDVWLTPVEADKVADMLKQCADDRRWAADEIMRRNMSYGD